MELTTLEQQPQAPTCCSWYSSPCQQNAKRFQPASPAPAHRQHGETNGIDSPRSREPATGKYGRRRNEQHFHMKRPTAKNGTVSEKPTLSTPFQRMRISTILNVFWGGGFAFNDPLQKTCIRWNAEEPRMFFVPALSPDQGFELYLVKGPCSEDRSTKGLS